MKYLFTIILLFTLAVNSQNQSTLKNVLFIMVDDLRPELNIYGQNKIISPNIDALGASGVTFDRAYCNVPVCGASRASLLTGMRPTANRFLNYHSRIKKDMPDVVNMAQYFKERGYSTVSNNKITHIKNDIDAWDDEWYPKVKSWRNYLSEENLILEASNKAGYAYENIDVPDAAYIDGQTALKSIEDLKQFKADRKPFFLAVGFVKPHLPFNAPKKYWDLYDRNTIMQPENYNYIPVDAPKMSITNWPEMRSYSNIPKQGQVSDSLAIDLIHGYYATVSYTDALIGEILNELKKQELDKNTVVVFVSDHGYNLQEHTQWAKFTNYNTSTQVPLIIYNPFSKAKGTTNALTALVDVYPTLAEICGIEVPKKQLDGTSLVSILNNPNLEGKKHVFIKKGNGFTLKTKDFSYTEFLKPKDYSTVVRMLYDHRKNKSENINVVHQKEFESIVSELSLTLHSMYQKNIYGK